MADGFNPRAHTCDEAYEPPPVEPTGETVAFVEMLAVEDHSDTPRVTHIRIDGDHAAAHYSNGDRGTRSSGITRRP